MLRRRAAHGEGSAADAVVPLTVRATASDGADIRLLIEARSRARAGAEPDVERIIHALVVPAAARWLRRHGLEDLASDAHAVGPDLERLVGEELSGLGVDLVGLDVVAVEHLLVSPSAGRAGAADDGSG